MDQVDSQMKCRRYGLTSDSMMRMVLLSLTLCVCACGTSTTDDSADMQDMVDMPDIPEEMPSYDHLPYGQKVESFEPGRGAGYGQDRMPDVVLGPPVGRGTNVGSLDVVSLGVGGEIVISFGDVSIVDGPGVDFVVFENPFWANGKAEDVFAELGEVSVSEDGEIWHTFTCDISVTASMTWPNCAGWTPTLAFDPLLVDPLSIEQTGGDGFDLSDLGVERARFVRIRDLSQEGKSPSAGFDLDSVGVIHAER